MTPLALAQALDIPFVRGQLWSVPITDAMVAYEIGSPIRQAAFLAQVGHETGGLKWVEERWRPTPAQVRYEGRRDLGNTEPGDGYRFRGRGLIQITGRANYERLGRETGIPCVETPDVLAKVNSYAARSAAWWWKAHGCNEIADGNTDDAFLLLTRRINGGTNGLDERRARWAVTKRILGVR